MSANNKYNKFQSNDERSIRRNIGAAEDTEPQSRHFTPLFIKQLISALVFTALLLSVNRFGNEKMRSYTAALGKALRNQSVTCETLTTVRDKAVDIYNRLPFAADNNR